MLSMVNTFLSMRKAEKIKTTESIIKILKYTKHFK